MSNVEGSDESVGDSELSNVGDMSLMEDMSLFWSGGVSGMEVIDVEVCGVGVWLGGCVEGIWALVGADPSSQLG